MPSEVASEKKKAGHINDKHFAVLIGGKVIPGSGKTDVVDFQGNAYSVKSAKGAQVFMYKWSRFLKNTEFQKIGNVASLIIACINVFSETLDDYKADKMVTKFRLQEPMQALKDEMCRPTILPQFLSKGLFNENEVGYISILPNELSKKNIPIDRKHFHVFSTSDVVHLFLRNLRSEIQKPADVDR